MCGFYLIVKKTNVTIKFKRINATHTHKPKDNTTQHFSIRILLSSIWDHLESIKKSVATSKHLK